MKVLADDKEVPSRTYYYLLDFNDKDDWEYMIEKFNKRKLCDLIMKEYVQLFEYATLCDNQALAYL